MALSDYQKASRIMASDSFSSRVKGLIIKTALDVKGEEFTTYERALPGGGTEVLPVERSRKRSQLADMVLNDPNAQLKRFGDVIACVPGVVAKYATILDDLADIEKIEAAVSEIQDADIEWTISSIWDDLAGVNGWDNGKV